MHRSPATARKRRDGLRAVALACAVLPLSACSPGISDSSSIATGPDPAAPHTAPARDTPSFTDAWAAEFASAYQNATSDFERAVLADGIITDQELSETRDRFTQCLTPLGYTNITFHDDDTYELDVPDEAVAGSDAVNQQIKECSVASGEAGIVGLYFWVRRNPDHLDESTIMAACLVREGVVERGYTATDYAKNLDDDTFPFLTGTPGEAALRTCHFDPLALHRDAPSRTKE